MEYSERIARLERFYEEGRLVRNDWGDGVECACLLTALCPEANTPGERTARIPADVLPPWVPSYIIMLADTAEDAAWPPIKRRFVKVARLLPNLNGDGWFSARKRFLANALDAAARNTLKRDEPEYTAIVVDVANVLRGDPTYMPRVVLTERVKDLRVPYDGVRESAVVRLMALVRIAYEDPARATHLLDMQVTVPILGECFLSALEEQCALVAANLEDTMKKNI